MMRTYKMIFAVAAVMVSAAGLSSTAKAQQWGPSAQSRYYHNPGNPPTYMNYNTSVAHTSTPAAAAVRPATHSGGPRPGQRTQRFPCNASGACAQRLRGAACTRHPSLSGTAGRLLVPSCVVHSSLRCERHRRSGNPSGLPSVFAPLKRRGPKSLAALS